MCPNSCVIYCQTLTIITNAKKENHNFFTSIDRTLIFLILFFIFCYVLLTAANCILITFHHNFGGRYLLLRIQPQNTVPNNERKDVFASVSRFNDGHTSHLINNHQL